MELNNMTYLRKTLEGMSTRQLDALLADELQRDQVDDKKVQMILDVLKERDRKQSHVETPEALAAWEKYTARVDASPTEQPRKRKWVARVAAIALVLLMLAVILPQEAVAKSLFDRLISWSNEFFNLLNPEDNSSADEYIFQTDNPGLQQVYDTVVEMGVSEPVVPMWMPAGYVLGECKINSTPSGKNVSAIFSNGSSDVGYFLDVYEENTSSRYYKDEEYLIIYEIDGITHNLIQNGGIWVVVWTRDNVECSIMIDCQEDELYRLIRSIYKLEES